MLMPKRVKWRKQQRNKIKGAATQGNAVAFGDYGLQALERGWIPANVIEAGRVAVNGDVLAGPAHVVTDTDTEERTGNGSRTLGGTKVCDLGWVLA